MNKMNKETKEQKKRNVTARALGAGVVGALAGGEIAGAMSSKSAPTMDSLKNRIIGGAAIGAGLNAANSIRKNVKFNRQLEERTAFDIVNESFEKIASKNKSTKEEKGKVKELTKAILCCQRKL